MTRGNQRDMARAKNAAKHADKGKNERSDGKTGAAAKESDAERMRKKQEAAEARKAEAEAAAAASQKHNKIVKQKF